ncbi:MAG: flavin monoamine oxidase family protein [Ilumatobacter sp.]
MEHREVVDVAVIGGGISGLAAARELVADGRSTVVLEARDRLGGRLVAVDHLDLGASWFWPNERRVRSLVSELGVEVHEQHLAGNARYHAPGGTQDIDGNPLDVPSFRFSRGADALARAVARELPEGIVRLNSAVFSVELDGSLAVVSGPAVSLAARHVVLALPPALAVHSIRFEPELDDELVGLAEATPVWMGGVTKVVARYADAFWRRNGWSGSAVSHVGPMRELHDMSGPDGVPAAIFGFVPAVRSGELTVEHDAVVAQLVELFGPEASSSESIEIRDWRREEFTSPPDVDCLTRYELFGHPRYREPALGGRLHWTSTETAPGFSGHIEGALAAAERTVRTLAASLDERPPGTADPLSVAP